MPDPEAVAQAENTLRVVATHGPSRRARALAAFVLGLGEAERQQTSAAAKDLARAATWAPVRDAATAALVRMWAQDSDDARALAAADRWPVAKRDVFAAVIGKPAARAAAKLQKWKQARRWAERFPSDPDMLWILAQADTALGNELAAAEAERKIYYEFPASVAAKQAGPAFLNSLHSMPQVAPTWRLEAVRAEAWDRAGNYKKAAGRFAIAARMAPRRVRNGLLARETRAWLADGNMEAAQARVQTLLHSSERAQALEIEVELARHRAQPGAIAAPIDALLDEFPRSRWTARALLQAGDEATLRFDAETTQKRFDQLALHFPRTPAGEKASWHAAWIAYRLNQSDTPQRLERYLREYPRGASVPDAIFWRGAWAEQHGQTALAQMCYETDARSFPGTYFGQQARARGKAAAKGAVAVDPPAPSWLELFQRNKPTPKAGPIPARLRTEVERARWMAQAGLVDPAAVILMHVLYEMPRGEASLELARETGKIQSERQAWNLGMRAMIRAVPDYAELQPEQLRPSDWKLLFPDPYPNDVAAAAREFGLNRYLVLGLIRQESGFNPQSISYAHARGLMQLELGTARKRLASLPEAWQLLKGPGRLSASDLLKPSLNLALGTAELSQLLQEFNEPAYALAGYNAGRSRVVEWKQKFPGLALDAFIESVPFTQTRNYIQAVLRNAERYREIYGP